MALLHLLSRSPFQTTDFVTCQQLLGNDDGILLCGDAVYALMPNTRFSRILLELPTSNAVYALQEDVLARRLVLPENVQSLDYSAFVELCTQYDKVNSWL